MTYDIIIELHNTEKIAIAALPDIPKRSKYRTLIYEFIALQEQMYAARYLELKKYLSK